MQNHLYPSIHELLAQNLAPGDQFQLQVSGGSMAPLIESGDSVICEVIDANAADQGDILLVLREHDLVIHRLVDCKSQEWTIKADNHNEADPVVQPGQIIGRVTQIEGRTYRLDLQSFPWNKINPILTWLNRTELAIPQLWFLVRAFSRGLIVLAKLLPSQAIPK